MFRNMLTGEVLVVWLFGLVLTLIPIAIAIWVLVVVSRIQRSIDRVAAAIERMAGGPHRVP